MKTRVSVVVVLLFALPAAAQDAYLVPCKGESRAMEVTLEDVGKKVTLVCPIKYHYDSGFQVLRIRDDGISATQRWPHFEEDPPNPIPWTEGTFDKKSCTAKVMPTGIGIEVSFVVPDRKTSLVIEYVSQNPYKTDNEGNRKLQLMINTSAESKPTWEQMLQAIGVPLLPGLK